MSFFDSDNIRFDEQGHKYFSPDGIELRAVSRIVNLVRMPFDRQGISYYVAKSKADDNATEADIKALQEETLQEWDDKLQSSHDHGNFIHNNIQDYLKKGRCSKEVMAYIHRMSFLWKQAYRFYSEQIIYLSKYHVAGRPDLILQRQKSKCPVLDIFDFKTNESKKMQFDSISRKKNVLKHYNRFLLPPLEHLEDCNYNTTCLQIGLYAVILQEQYGFKIGRLGIIFVDAGLEKVTLFPVPFMKYECIALLDHYNQIKQLPFKIDGPGTVTRLQEQKNDNNDDEEEKW